MELIKLGDTLIFCADGIIGRFKVQRIDLHSVWLAYTSANVTYVRKVDRMKLISIVAKQKGA